MFATTDTIVAVATPPGRGGIGVVRLSGPDARAIAARLTAGAELEPRHATFTTVRTPSPGAADRVAGSERGTAAHDAVAEGCDGVVDHALVTFFPAPHSYTGDDVIEVSAHGSPVVLRAIVEAAMSCGARLAEP